MVLLRRIAELGTMTRTLPNVPADAQVILTSSTTPSCEGGPNSMRC